MPTHFVFTLFFIFAYFSSIFTNLRDKYSSCSRLSVLSCNLLLTSKDEYVRNMEIFFRSEDMQSMLILMCDENFLSFNFQFLFYVWYVHNISYKMNLYTKFLFSSFILLHINSLNFLTTFTRYLYAISIFYSFTTCYQAFNGRKKGRNFSFLIVWYPSIKYFFYLINLTQ